MKQLQLQHKIEIVGTGVCKKHLQSLQDKPKGKTIISRLNKSKKRSLQIYRQKNTHTCPSLMLYSKEEQHLCSQLFYMK
jgi:REP element-mobilizing transposase RayT